LYIGTVSFGDFIKYREYIENSTINVSKSQFLEFELLKINNQKNDRMLPKNLLLWMDIKNLIEETIEEKVCICIYMYVHICICSYVYISKYIYAYVLIKL
jgi:hypothetical protein